MIERKKILLVSSSFYPEISPRSFRATELAKEYSKRGHEVTVITKSREFDYVDFLKNHPVNLKMWKNSMFLNVPLTGIKALDIIMRGLYRILSIVFEFPAITELYKVKSFLKKENGYDLLISFAVPHPVHWGTAKVQTPKHRIAKKWVADCGDPYMFSRFDSFRKPFYFKSYEMDWCTKCDFVSIPFIDLKTQFYPQFESKMVEIPQGFDFGEIKLSKNRNDHGKPVFLFAGSVIPGIRDLNQLMEFLKKYDQDFLFIIYTNQNAYYQEYKRMLGERIEVRPYIDRLTLIFEMSKVDFLVNVDTIHDNEENIKAIPSKLIDYALSERPILNLNSASLDEDKVSAFLNKDYTDQRVIDKAKYDIRLVADKFLSLV
ncbi:hypothetical protein [Saccharicrinis sp. 156]|uniref:hypothetical protein n=1 Tax=Saccharicrinis sp. 156 TaxID=3417574 RepID=UPI003D33DA8B